MQNSAQYTPSKIAVAKAAAFVEEMKSLGYKPRKAIVFGSFAKFSQHPQSDIDLAVWDERFEGCTPFDTEPLLRLIRKYSPIELHTFSLEDTYENHPFVKEIVDTGIKLKI